jgi:hypothetical protein
MSGTAGYLTSVQRAERELAARAHAEVVACGREHRASWRVIQRHGNASAFNGYRWADSDYSAVRCGGCGRVWRTRAAYVESLPDA